MADRRRLYYFLGFCKPSVEEILKEVVITIKPPRHVLVMCPNVVKALFERMLNEPQLFLFAFPLFHPTNDPKYLSQKKRHGHKQPDHNVLIYSQLNVKMIKQQDHTTY